MKKLPQFCKLQSLSILAIEIQISFIACTCSKSRLKRDCNQTEPLFALIFFDSLCLKGLYSLHSSVKVKVSVKENEVPIEKNSSRASIFSTKASYISN